MLKINLSHNILFLKMNQNPMKIKISYRCENNCNDF